MTGQAEIIPNVESEQVVTTGAIKFLRDVGSVLEMKLLFLLRGWYWYLIRPLVFPLGVLFWLKVMVPDDPEVNLRVMAGAVVFGVSLSTANMLSQQIVQDRFLGRIRLLVTMPMSKVSYALGVLAFSAVQATPIIVVLLAVSPFAGVDLELTWAVFPLLVAALFSIAGIALLIGSYAPTVEIGGIMSNLFGVVLVMVSPVFFTMEQAPIALKWLGWVSPMRYAADGIMKSISGSTDIWTELAVLAGFAVAAMALGLWKLRWREN
ncbi:MAG: ABC transporter permease [Chloroflexi bacterium]|nr:ABC transporter permease [Chloroflexota bacterium]